MIKISLRRNNTVDFGHRRTIMGTVLFVFLLLLHFSCAKRQINDRFSRLANDFLDNYWTFYPIKASMMGLHDFDNQMDNWEKDAINKRTKKLHDFQQQLNNIDSTLLTNQNKIDYIILQHQIKAEFWELKSKRPWENNATFYNDILKQAILGITSNEHLSSEHKCKNLINRLKQFPGVILLAEENLVKPKRLSVDLAIEQVIPLQFMLTSEITKIVHQCPEWQDSLLFYNNLVSDSLINYSNYLKKELLLSSEKEQPIGEDLYLQILKDFYQIDWTIDKIIAEAEKERHWCYQQIVDISTDLHQKYFPKQGTVPLSDKRMVEKVLDRLSDKYKADNLLIDLVNKINEDIKIFIETKEIFKIPEDYKLNIVRTPEWEDSYPLVYLKTPGPFENEQKYFYCLKSPTDNLNWLDQISFSRRFNKSRLEVLTIQNVLPGKLLLSTELNKHRSVVRKVFRDKNLTAGWPLYAGFIMTETGYGGYDLRIRLQNLILYLQEVVSLLMDFKYHTSQITAQQAIFKLVDESFMNLNQAQFKLTQIQLNPARQISPFWGYIQLRNIFRECRLLAGNYFDRTMLWERMLNNGAIPLPLLRKKLKYDIKNK